MENWRSCLDRNRDRNNNADHFSSTLKDEWSKYVAKYGKNRPRVVDQHSVGLVGRAYRLFMPDFDYELSDSVSDSINQLSTDWNFLNMLVRAILEWRDEQVRRKSTLWKINSLGREIEDEIRACDFGKKYIFNRPQKLFILLGDCRRKTDALLKEDIGEAREYYSNLTLLKFYSLSHFSDSYRPPDSFWENLMIRVEKNLRSIIVADDGCPDKRLFALYHELKLIRGYLNDVGKIIRSSDEFLTNHAFVTRVSSVVVRISSQSCAYWFNRKDTDIARIKAIGLADFHHQIDPRKPEFINLILGFQEALFRCEISTAWPENVGYFCAYILTACSNGELQKQLASLVTIFIHSTLRTQTHSSREDVHSLFAEIDAMLAEAAFHHRAVVCPERETNDSHPCSHLLHKIRILEAELSLKEQLSTMTSSVPFHDVQLLKVDETLKNLRGVTKDLFKHGETEYGKQNLVLARELNDEVQSLYASLKSKKMTTTSVVKQKHWLLQLLYKIVFFKAESFLSELLINCQNGESSIADGKDQIESLVLELEYLKRVVTNQLVTKNLPDQETISIQVEAVARRISLLSYSFLPDTDKFKEVLLSLPHLFNTVKGIKAKLEEVSSSFPIFSFPKTFELGFIEFLGRNIKEVLKYDQESIAPVKHYLKQAQSHLESFKSSFIKVSDSHIQMAELNDLCTHIRDLAYKLEYVVESIEVDGRFEHSIWLYDLLEDIRHVNEQVSTISETSCAVKIKNTPQVSCETISKDATTAINEMMVDLVDEEKVIIERLMSGSSRRDVVSIVGMPGIGKTTLAKKVFNDQNVVHHFSRRAWCTVSQTYSKRELLLDLLSDVHEHSDKFYEMSDEDLQSKLRRCLLRNKYLIILDDVWDIAAWHDLEISFPDDSNGSRILITSRLRDVHSELNTGSDPHLIRLFSDEESWMLLEKKIFKGVGCPRGLLLVGKQIAGHCQGLPLAIVAIAGLLQKTEKTQDWWEKISESLSSQVINDPDPENRCKEILEMSYKHLPEYLKACFLYLGVFLRGKDIPVSKLTQFWMAEGFIQQTESKSLEDVAQDYLMELINRSLVTISKTRSNGKVKACRLHDLLRDLCHLKATEENFLHQVTRYDKPYAFFPASEYDMQFRNKQKLDPVTFESYRLSIYLRRNHFIDSRPSGPRTRTLIFFASVDKEPRCPYEISFICNNFKLLRVLDLECINMGVSFPVEIGVMFQLRYLAVSGYVQSVPPSIANLWKLQTLVVKGFRGTVILPNTIWSMASLRHLHVNDHVSFDLPDDDEQVGSSFHLDNLVSFSTPSISCEDNTINILRRLPNLLKMKCIFLESWDSSESCNGFPILEFLTRLESLKISYYGRAINSGEFILPWSLKKLTMSNFRLPWNHISRIGGLPNLKVLKLLSGAFEGPKWEMKEEEFKELEFLKLDALNIAEWSATYDHLPNLKRLVLRNCKHLEEIPQDFAYINTLEMIEVQWCGKSVEESAERIGNETKEIKVVMTNN